jgi:hypothetical protein
MLGYALADSPIIYIDYNAAGYGWQLEGQSTKNKGQSGPGSTLLDSITPVLQHSITPLLHYSNTPTLQHASTPILQHSNTPLSTGGMDLTTVLAHELGHVLGHEDLDPATHPHDIMSATLAAGERLEVGGQRLEVRGERLEVGGERLEVRDERSVISDPLSVISDPATADLRRESRYGGSSTGGRSQRAAIGDVWSVFGDLDDSDAEAANQPSEISHLKSQPEFRIRDALFARLYDRAGDEDDDILLEPDDSSEEPEDVWDLWWFQSSGF